MSEGVLCGFCFYIFFLVGCALSLFIPSLVQVIGFSFLFPELIEPPGVFMCFHPMCVLFPSGEDGRCDMSWPRKPSAVEALRAWRFPPLGRGLGRRFAGDSGTAGDGWGWHLRLVDEGSKHVLEPQEERYPGVSTVC